MVHEHQHGGFDERAKDWDDQPGRREHARRVATTVADALGGTPVRDALEIGAGTGLLALEVSDALGDAPRFTLADTSAGMREVAQARVDDARLPWTVVDLDLTTSSADEDYDLVLTHMTLHHVDDLPALLRSVRSALRPGGAFVALDLTDDNDGFHDTPADAQDAGYHHDGFGEAALRRLLLDAGFASVDHSVPLTVTKTRDGVDREFPLFLVVAR